MVESVYSAVRTDSLYKADYGSSLKGQKCIIPGEICENFRYVNLLIHDHKFHRTKLGACWTHDAAFHTLVYTYRFVNRV